VGLIAQKAGVDWIFVDMEYRGKKARQAHRDTVISAHDIEDVKAMRKVITSSKLLVRINPWGDWSKNEINQVIKAGADIIMLPYFSTVSEVSSFLNQVDARAKTCLLLETLSAINILDELLVIPGIDFVHIGLNDIHIERRTTFMFEFLADGGVDRIATKLRNANIPFGFGGIARIGELVPRAERILAEHFRLGSAGVILSRSFCPPSRTKGDNAFEAMFKAQVAKLRKQETLLCKQQPEFFEKNRLRVVEEVKTVVSQIEENSN
jgi:hypothetical protein